MSSIDPSKLSGVTPPPMQLDVNGGQGDGGQTSTSYGDVVLGGPQMDYFLNTQEAAISASLDQFNQNLAITEEFQSDVQDLLNAINEVPLLTPDEITSMSQSQMTALGAQATQAANDLEAAEAQLVAFCQEPATQTWLGQNPDFASQLNTWMNTDYPSTLTRIQNEAYDLDYGDLANLKDYHTGAIDTSSLNSLMESLTTISSSETTQFSVLTKEQLSLVKAMQNFLTTISQTATQIVNQIAPT